MRQYACDTVVGLTRGVQKEFFILATLESITYQTNDVIEAMELKNGVNVK